LGYSPVHKKIIPLTSVNSNSFIPNQFAIKIDNISFRGKIVIFIMTMTNGYVRFTIVLC